MALISHFGSKSRLVGLLTNFLPAHATVLVSPFMGGGALEYAVAANCPNIEQVLGFDNLRPLVVYHQQLLQNATRLRTEIQSLGLDRPLPNNASFEHLLELLGSRSRSLTPVQQAAIVFALGNNCYSGNLGRTQGKAGSGP
ncbi:g6938 [Coccomyxa elongata]